MSSTNPLPTKPSSWRRYWWVLLLVVALPFTMCGVLTVGALFLSEAGVTSIGKPAMPITVTWRNSLIGKGRVLLVINHSDRPIHGVSITMDAPNGQTTTRTIPTLTPHETLEIGWFELDPWTVESGKTATFRHQDYQSYRFRVP